MSEVKITLPRSHSFCSKYAPIIEGKTPEHVLELITRRLDTEDIKRFSKYAKVINQNECTILVLFVSGCNIVYIAIGLFCHQETKILVDIEHCHGNHDAFYVIKSELEAVIMDRLPIPPLIAHDELKDTQCADPEKLLNDALQTCERNQQSAIVRLLTYYDVNNPANATHAKHINDIICRGLKGDNSEIMHCAGLMCNKFAQLVEPETRSVAKACIVRLERNDTENDFVPLLCNHLAELLNDIV